MTETACVQAAGDPSSFLNYYLYHSYNDNSYNSPSNWYISPLPETTVPVTSDGVIMPSGSEFVLPEQTVQPGLITITPVWPAENAPWYVPPLATVPFQPMVQPIMELSPEMLDAIAKRVVDEMEKRAAEKIPALPDDVKRKISL